MAVVLNSCPEVFRSCRAFPNFCCFPREIFGLPEILWHVSKLYFQVNGDYRPYVPQDPCNETCGQDGTEIQIRHCDSLPPDPMGMICPNGLMDQRTVNCNRIDFGLGKLLFSNILVFFKFMLNYIKQYWALDFHLEFCVQ